MSFQTGYDFGLRWWEPLRSWWFGAKTWTSLDEAVRHAGRVRQLHLLHDYDLAPLGSQFAQ